jgi:hypothetical protein
VDIVNKRLTAVSTNENGLNEIAILLKSFGIRSRFRKNSTVGNRSACFNLRITGRRDIVIYRDKIGF